VVGLGLISTEFLIMSFWPTIPSYAEVWFGTATVVAGMTFATITATDSLLSAVPSNASGVGSALNDVTREIGGALGVAILGAILSVKFVKDVNPHIQMLPASTRTLITHSLSSGLMNAPSGIVRSYVKEAWMNGFTEAMFVSFIVLGIMTFIVGFIFPKTNK
jgi:hypothetical protein